MLNHSEYCRPPQSRQTTVRHRFDLIGWILPTTGLTPLPRCPIRLAGWVALFAALVVSFWTAPSLTAFLIVGYVAIQFYFMYRITRHLYRTLHRGTQ